MFSATFLEKYIFDTVLFVSIFAVRDLSPYHLCFVITRSLQSSTCKYKTYYKIQYISTHLPKYLNVTCIIWSAFQESRAQFPLCCVCVEVWYWTTVQWRHNERDVASNHRCLDCLLNRLFMRKSKKTLKPPVTGLGEGNPPVTDGLPSRRTSNAENVSIWWRHHEIPIPFKVTYLASWDCRKAT